jgi:FkbM family methyltransferase
MIHTIDLYAIYKYLTSTPYRKKFREKRRLAGAVRYRPGTTTLLGRPLRYVDANTCYYGFLEIFEKEPYKFKSSRTAPLIIDCGANIGLSVLYFKQAYPDATVIAFEPDPQIFQVLEANMRAFGLTDTTALEAAVWTTDGEVDFQMEGGMSGRIPKSSDVSGLQTVKSLRLRNFLTMPVDFLKIDIEGAEFSVIKDCEDLLLQVEHLFLEYHSHQDEPQQLDEILAILTRSGFRYHIHEAFTVRSPFVDRATMLGMDLQLNIYARRT